MKDQYIRNKLLFFSMLAAVIVRVLTNENGPTHFTRYPYVVSIQSYFTIPVYNITNVISHICEGTTIEPRWVVTAARCLTHDGYAIEFKNVRIIAGSTAIQIGKRYEYIPTRAQWITNADGCDEEDPTKTVVNDIAMLELDTPIETEFAQHLPIFDGDISELNLSTCTTAYWGNHINVMYFYNLYFYPHNMYQKLRASDVTIEECPPVEDKKVEENTICARRAFQEDFAKRCTSSSGSPLVCEEKLVAIMLEDNSCRDQPNRYLLVKSHAEWLRGMMAAKARQSYPGNLSIATRIPSAAVVVPLVITIHMLR